MAEPARGVFFAVVGPSGAGKDTLIDAARQALADDLHYVFVRRAITRPADAGGEAHHAMSDTEFAAEEAAGQFALSWRAHGLAYGIPSAIESAVVGGRHVVANLSRGVVVEAAARFAPIRVLHVTAPADILRERLARRGREDTATQAARVSRSATLPIEVPVIEIVNDGTVETGAARLLAALQAAAANGAR